MSGRVAPTSIGRSLGDAWTAIRELQRKPPPAASGGSGLPFFAMTGGPFTVDDEPIPLDSTQLVAGSMHFSTTDAATFDATSDNARILVPGSYVIGLQVQCRTASLLGADRDVWLQIKYHGDIGYGIEIPWLGFSTGPAERVLGTHFTFPNGSGSGWDIALQRLHPISVTDATTFPLKIEPNYYASDGGSGATSVQWMGLWGFRVGDQLDSYHSD